MVDSLWGDRDNGPLLYRIFSSKSFSVIVATMRVVQPVYDTSVKYHFLVVQTFFEHQLPNQDSEQFKHKKAMALLMHCL